ncbi:MAG TPA: hypothetical protein VIU41_11415 [Geobacteraceae bacterium]
MPFPHHLRFLLTILAVALVAVGGCAHRPPAATLPSGATQLPLTTTTPGSPFAFTPVGDRVAFVASGLRLAQVPGAHAGRIEEATPSLLAWSTDGATLAAAFPEGEQTRLSLFAADGTPLISASVFGTANDLCWRSADELLIGVVTTQTYRFGTNIKEVLYRWDGKAPPEGNVLHEATVRPFTMKTYGNLILHGFHLAVSPLGDEIVYSRIQDPPEFAPYLKLMLRHLVTGQERELLSSSLNSGPFVITADGDHLLYANGKGNVYRRNIWSEGIDEIFAVPGKQLTAATSGQSLFIDDTFYLSGAAIASFADATGGALSARGDRLLVRTGNRLWLVSGLPAGATLNLSPAHLRQLITLRRLRSEGAITQNDYLQTLKQLLGHP